jgi:hypothetical protein
MDGSESGNDMIFCSTDMSFSEVGAVVVGGGELNNTGRCGGAEERFYFGGGFVIGDEVSNGVAEVGEERKGGRESFDIGGGVFRWHRDDVGISVVYSDKEIFHAASRLMWKSSSNKVGSGPVLSGDNKGLCLLTHLLRKRFGRKKIFW